jgi:hypothetical protein
MKTKLKRFSETSVDCQRKTRRYIPVDRTFKDSGRLRTKLEDSLSFDSALTSAGYMPSTDMITLKY